MKTYRDLILWQNAYKLAVTLYEESRNFPKEELYGLTSQMRRAVVSVSSIIAEGFGRGGAREKDQFYAIAHGSLYEVESQLFIARGVGYIDQDVHADLLSMCESTSRLLQGLRKANKLKGRDSSIKHQESNI